MSIDSIINKIDTQLRKRSLFAVFDRDGTLVPFNPSPEKAIFSASVKYLLQDLAACPRVSVALLSARDLGQLSNDFDKQDLILAGNYGMEISFPDRQNFVNEIAASSRPLLSSAKEKIEEKLSPETKTILEDHGLTLCLHWHLTPAEHLGLVHSVVSELKHSFPKLIFRTLPTSYEIWPPVKWDKACGLDELERILQINWQDWFPLYAGDSRSDEAAFKWVNDRQGISLHIGADSESAAQLQIESPAQMAEFLKKLVKLTQGLKRSAR
jgi:trehalose 6-phosphate phosphatase